MESLIIEEQYNLPKVNFNPITGLLILKGRSIPENPTKFYQPLENWVNEFILTQPASINFDIHVDYLNTHSTECLLILLKYLRKYDVENNADVKVVWKYDEFDEDMQELGEDLASIINISFEIIEVKED